jgi:hypothetical protein
VSGTQRHLILRQWIHVPDFSRPLRLLLDSNQTLGWVTSFVFLGSFDGFVPCLAICIFRVSLHQTGHFLMAHIIFDGIRLGRQKFQNIFSG